MSRNRSKNPLFTCAIDFRNSDEIVGSCGADGLRVWQLPHGRQLLHVEEERQLGGGAACMLFTPDGSHIVAGFEGGCVRAYTPQSGNLEQRRLLLGSYT